jgi:hypothetical protein
MIPRIPANSLSDFTLEEASYEPDFELTARFEAFATELERLSLLGIGAYGFLLTTVGFDKSGPTPYLLLMKGHAYLLGFGVIAFAFSAAFALLSNFLSNKCLGCQLDIVRMYSRLDSSRYDPEQQKVNLNFARYRQRRQKHILLWNRAFLFSSTLSLCAGAFAVALAFARILL